MLKYFDGSIAITYTMMPVDETRREVGTIIYVIIDTATWLTWGLVVVVL